MPTHRGDLYAIRAEFQTQGVGPLMLAEVRRVAASMVGRYNAAVYTDIGNWRHGLDDLVQDVVAVALLRDRQAEYLMRQCVTIDDLDRLLRFQTKRVLARRRNRTVVDNLLDRSRLVLQGPPFQTRTRHLQVTFTLEGSDRADRAATFVELRGRCASVTWCTASDGAPSGPSAAGLRSERPSNRAHACRRFAAGRLHDWRTRSNSSADLAGSASWRP